jgi:hypothetical protein
MGIDDKTTFIKNDCFIQQLYDNDSPSGKFSLLEKEVRKAGFNAALYTFIPKLSQLSNSLEPVFQYSNIYQQRMRDYKNNQTYRDDFVIRLFELGNTQCIDWWEISKQIELTKKEKHANHKTKEHFGVSRGISFPTLNNDMGIAYVSVIKLKDNTSNNDISSEMLAYLNKCSQVYHDHAMTHQDLRYHFILPILRTLTPKKVTLIEYLISGKPINCISKHENISTRYAEKLLIETRKQFGNISTNELIYLMGCLNIAEYI